MKNYLIFVLSYISINFILLILFRDSEYIVQRFLYFHIIIILFLLIKGIILFTKNKKSIMERTKNIKDKWAKQGFISAAFTRSSGHNFLCYIGFVYIFITLYFFYLLYKGKIHNSNKFIIIFLIFLGFIISIKETYTHFTQCINSTENNSTIPYCDDHYYKYWNCIHNEYVSSEEST
jgi:hypothetical protein